VNAEPSWKKNEKILLCLKYKNFKTYNCLESYIYFMKQNSLFVKIVKKKEVFHFLYEILLSFFIK
jgi:hypothetical protein